jgi:GT2 family glycosyltransferase
LKIRRLIIDSARVITAKSDDAIFYPNADSALFSLLKQETEFVILGNARAYTNNLPALPPDFEAYDLLHAGLCLGGSESFRSLWLASTDWRFLNPQSDRRCVSWKATPEACCLRPEAVRQLGGLDSAYSTPVARLMDLAYRMISSGGRVCHDPSLLMGAIPDAEHNSPPVPLLDELIFILRYISPSAAMYVAFWLSLITKHPFQILTGLRMAFQRVRSMPAPQPQSNSAEIMHLMSSQKRQRVASISAIIPTLERYDYLPQAIQSLLEQVPKPDEIVIVDQSPPDRRRPDIYAAFADENVHVIYLDRAGQSIARNTAIRASRGDWCLLFDDDSVAWDDMLAQHIQSIESSGATVSTGVSLAPWKTVENIPAHIRHFHLTDVLDTGNCLIKKQSIQDVGGLDQAFDSGSGADHDLGVRLYLHGDEILFNPKAIRTHYKANTGGLRTYGAMWRNRTSFWDPFPPPTQVYTIRRYYPHTIWLPLWIQFFISAKNRYSFLEYLWLWTSSPWKLARSIQAANRLVSDVPINQKNPY